MRYGIKLAEDLNCISDICVDFVFPTPAFDVSKENVLA
jgi:hypothetical protein